MSMNRNDLHIHVLPGVDDGPADLGEALALAADAVADGTTLAVTTPHIRPGYVTDVTELPDRVAEFQLELARERIPLQLRVGGELAHGMVDRLSQYELELIAQGPPGARWILLEAPFPGFGPAFHDAADELRERGFGVVIGHPERSARLGEDLASLRHEVLYGSVLQLNVWTIAGRHGEEARDIALRLVGEGLASVVASDAHADWRRPLIGRAVNDLLRAGVDHMSVRALTATGPRRLLEAGLRGRRRVTAPAA
jgi:protein-tyrosine phosphatase